MSDLLNFKFIRETRLVSTNDAYIPTYYKSKNNRRRGAFLRKSSELKDWQDFVARSFDSEYFYSKEYLSMISSYVNNLNLGLRLDLIISIPKDDYYDASNRLKRNDSSNFIKSIEDSIARGIGIDDTSNILVSARKGYNEDNVWYLEAKLNIMSIHNRIDVDVKGSYYEESSRE